MSWGPLDRGAWGTCPKCPTQNPALNVLTGPRAVEYLYLFDCWSISEFSTSYKIIDRCPPVNYPINQMDIAYYQTNQYFHCFSIKKRTLKQGLITTDAKVYTYEHEKLNVYRYLLSDSSL